MRIKSTVRISVIFTIILAGAVGAALLVVAQSVNKGSKRVRTSVKIIKEVAELRIVTDEYLLYGEERAKMQWQLQYDSLTKILSEEEFNNPGEEVILDKILHNHTRVKTIFHELMAGREKDIINRELEDRLVSLLLVNSQEMVSAAFRLHHDIDDSLAIAQQITGLLIVAFLVIMTGLIIATSLWVSRRIVTPIARLEEGTHVIAAGNLDYKVGTAAKDEIGNLSKAFDQMTNELKTTTVSRDELAKEIAERKRAEQKLKEIAENLEEKVAERTKELEETQERLIRREKLAVLGQLAGSLSHELRNPLTTISNAVYYLKETLHDADQTTREYLEIIATEVGSSARIIGALLDFTRSRQPERTQVEVPELVSLVLDKHSTPVGVKVSVEIPSGAPAVLADPQQLERVLGNLITNACQAMPEGGKLTVSVSVGGGRVRLAVADTGCGISKKAMGRLFEPLYTTRTGGFGLGLTICKNLVQANGGSIEVESEEGRGSTFIVTLPTRGAKL